MGYFCSSGDTKEGLRGKGKGRELSLFFPIPHFHCTLSSRKYYYYVLLPCVCQSLEVSFIERTENETRKGEKEKQRRKMVLNPFLSIDWTRRRNWGH